MHQPAQRSTSSPRRAPASAWATRRTRLSDTTAGLAADLVLIRGIPGSGKSTMAAGMASAGFTHLEADMFFMQDGIYTYDAARVRDAHVWCQQMARQALADGRRVVVSNTFTRLHEMEPYLGMARAVRIVEAHGRWTNTHSVPADVVERMAQRWEPLPPGDKQAC